jgi:hypothetical protein
VAADQSGAEFDQFAIFTVERGREVAIDIKLTANFVVYENGSNDFGLGFCRTR